MGGCPGTQLRRWVCPPPSAGVIIKRKSGEIPCPLAVEAFAAHLSYICRYDDKYSKCVGARAQQGLRAVTQWRVGKAPAASPEGPGGGTSPPRLPTKAPSPSPLGQVSIPLPSPAGPSFPTCSYLALSQQLARPCTLHVPLAQAALSSFSTLQATCISPGIDTLAACSPAVAS